MHRLCFVLALLLAFPLRSSAQLAFLVDAETNCRSFTLPLFVQVHGSIVLHSTGSVPIAGAEFRIVGMPSTSDVFVTATANPAAASATGDPFGTGARIVFSACAAQDLLLYDVTMFAVAPQDPITIEFVGTDSSSPCPTVLGCALDQTCTSGSLGPSPGQTILLSPADGATDVPLDVQLEWAGGASGANCCGGLPWWILYFGTEPEPPLLHGGVDEPYGYSPGPLQPRTTYYWRVSTHTCVSGSTSPVWTFTTGRTIAVQQLGWTQVKGLFR